MRKSIVWASCLTLVVVGGFLASCDSKGSSPTSSTDTTGQGNNNVATVHATFTFVNPAGKDTLLTNDVSSVTVKIQTDVKTGVTAKINGANASGTNGALSSKIQDIPVGLTKYPIVAASVNDTVKDTITVRRQLGAPQIVATTGQPGQTDFTDSVTVQFRTVDNNSADSIHYSTGGITVRILPGDPFVANNATKKITGTTTFRAIAYRKIGSTTVQSDTTTQTFVIGKTLGKPYFGTNRNDSFTMATKIGIGGYGKDDTVRYTTDGGDPTRDNSRVYSNTDSILVQTTERIIAKTFNGGNSSPTCTTDVKLKAISPTFSAKSGTYTSQIKLSIKSASGIPVYYTTDGSTPTNQSLKASDSMVVDSNVTVKAVAILPGWTSSSVVSASYKFKVANPTLSSRTGNYDTTQLLVMTDSAAGASIRYTLDGSTPTCGSALYNPDSALRLDSNVVVKARACRTGWDSSDVATGNFTFKVAKIAFSPDSGIYRNNQIVKLSTRSPGVTLYVTRDSTQPTWNASGDPTGTTRKLAVNDTLLITKSQWLRVVAARSGWANSTADSRRYIIEGDTLLVDDFEQNSLTNPIGTNWRFWACGYCVNTGIPDQMSTISDSTNSDWNKQIGFRNGHIAFHIPAAGANFSADGHDGPGYAGYSVGVPSNLMGETYRLVFWARWKPTGSTTRTSVPLVTEMTWSKNDNQNGYYHDGFQRYIDTLGSTWRRFVIDYHAFTPAGNAYDSKKITVSDSTAEPKSYWLFYYPDSARMVNIGLSKFQGTVLHDASWAPKWVWGADHDAWDKTTLTNFRWSILQPNSNKAGLAALSHYDQNPVYDYSSSSIVRCGDCHYPDEPGFSDALKSGFQDIDGTLELDRIQLVRRPQAQGGTGTIVVTDTTTKK